MGRLTKRQIDLDNKTETQLKIINNYFFVKRFSPYKISDRHYCDLVLDRRNQYECFKRALKKLNLSQLEIDLMVPISSLSFCYDGDYLYKNGNSSKAKYLCVFLGTKQIYAYTYIYDMACSNFVEKAEEIYFNSIVAISTEEKVCESEVDLYGFISPTGRRTIHTVFTLKITTSGGVFEFAFPKTPSDEKEIAEMREKIRAFRTIRFKKYVEDIPIE